MPAHSLAEVELAQSRDAQAPAVCAEGESLLRSVGDRHYLAMLPYVRCERDWRVDDANSTCASLAEPQQLASSMQTEAQSQLG